MPRRRKGRAEPLEVVTRDCAGTGIGRDTHHLAVDPDRCAEPVRSFGAFTPDLGGMADWLSSRRVGKVAMEPAPVYWIPVLQVLDRAGSGVLPGPPGMTKQISGRRSDVPGCQWIRQLLSYGLLRGAFRPGDGVCPLRSHLRRMKRTAGDRPRCVPHMRKALTETDVRLDPVTAGITGATGLGILRATGGGGRSPARLAALRNRRTGAGGERIADALEGTWRDGRPFALERALQRFDFLTRRIGTCGARIAEAIDGLTPEGGGPDEGAPDGGPADADPGRAAPKARRGAAGGRKAGDRAMAEALRGMMGAGLTAVPTIGVGTALTIAAEVGPDMSAFPSAQHPAPGRGWRREPGSAAESPCRGARPRSSTGSRRPRPWPPCPPAGARPSSAPGTAPAPPGRTRRWRSPRPPAGPPAWSTRWSRVGRNTSSAGWMPTGAAASTEPSRTSADGPGSPATSSAGSPKARNPEMLWNQWVRDVLLKRESLLQNSPIKRFFFRKRALFSDRGPGYGALWGVLTETANSLSLQGECDGDGRVVSERRHCPEVAGYPAAGLRERDGPEASGYLPPHPGHPEIPFGAVVRERGVGAPCEAQDVPSRGGEASRQVVGVGPPHRPALALPLFRDRRHPAAALPGMSLWHRATVLQWRMDSHLSGRRVTCRRATGGSPPILSAHGQSSLSVTAWSLRGRWGPQGRCLRFL